MQALEIQAIKMQALLIAMHLFFDLWNSACFMFQKLLSLFCFHSFNTYMFYQIKRTALLELIPFIDVSISIGTVEHKADIKD